jgi:Transcriptional regulator PadR-like family
VLALLRDQPRYGFDLVRSLAQANGLVTSEGTIYPLLGRLRRDGLVTTTWHESPSGPPRRYYQLTDEGGGRWPCSPPSGTASPTRSTACCGKEAAHDHRSRRPGPPLPPRSRIPAGRPARQPSPGAAGRGREHIAAARADLDPETEAGVRSLLERLGEPADIAAEARDRFGVQARPARPATPWLEIATIVLLVIPFLGWVLGAILVWLSRLWTTGDKLVGTVGGLSWVLGGLGTVMAGRAGAPATTS